jgi:hypothetical protein
MSAAEMPTTVVAAAAEMPAAVTPTVSTAMTPTVSTAVTAAPLCSGISGD